MWNINPTEVFTWEKSLTPTGYAMSSVSLFCKGKRGLPTTVRVLYWPVVKQTLSYVRALGSINLFSPLLEKGQFFVYPTAHPQNAVPRILALWTCQTFQSSNARFSLWLLLVMFQSSTSSPGSLFFLMERRDTLGTRFHILLNFFQGCNNCTLYVVLFFFQYGAIKESELQDIFISSAWYLNSDCVYQHSSLQRLTPELIKGWSLAEFQFFE